MELADVAGVVRRRWYIAVLTLVACAGASLAFSLTQTKEYSSSISLLVSTGNLAKAPNHAQAIEAAGAYSQLAATRPAVTAAVAAAGADPHHVTVTTATDGVSPIFAVTAQSNDPRTAQRVAQIYAQVLPGVIVQLQRTTRAAPPEFTVLEAAQLPTEPSSPRPLRNGLIGVALGLMLGFGLMVLREALDGRVRDGVQLERAADVVLLGLIPREFRTLPVPSLTRPRSRRAEAYRAVRTNLEFLAISGMPRSVVVTSAQADEGKSSLSANLAVVASRAGRNVVLVDADLRKPSVAGYFGLQSPIGLTDVLAGRWSVDEALQWVNGERLWVLASGPVPEAPGELVGSAAMASLIEHLEQRFDLVIIDTPPVLPVSDSLALAVNVDGVVLVARMRDTTRKAVQKAADAVRRVNATLLGVVGNAAVANGEDAIYGYGDGYRSKTELGRAEQAELSAEVQPLQAGGRRGRGGPTRARAGTGSGPRVGRRQRLQPDERAWAEAVDNLDRVDLHPMERAPDTWHRTGQS